MKSIRFAVIALTMFSVFLLAIQPDLFTKLNGAPSDNATGGYTGGTKENGRLCTACHTGTALYRDNLISSDVPAEGYTPGQDYTITVSITESGINRFGFQASPQTVTGAAAGSMTATTGKTHLSTNPNYMTHTFSGTNGSGGSNSWTFSWQAPSAGTGTVDFFVAVNATNSNNSTTGDQIYFDTLQIAENTATLVSNPADRGMELKAYPTVTSGLLNIDWRVIPVNNTVALQLLDIHGQLVRQFPAARQGRQQEDISSLAPGTYFLTLASGTAFRTIRILKF